ncbi:MAG: hypothetical protein ACRCTJ_00370, partial [Brevinema sp.]
MSFLLVLLIPSIMGIFSMNYILKHKSELLTKYHYRTLHFWLTLVFALISAFILVGGTFFLPLNTPVFFRNKLHEYFIYFILVILMFINSITSIEVLKKYSLGNQKNISNSDLQKTFWQVFILFFSVSLIFWYIFYPGIISDDSISVLSMIKYNDFNTHHTVLYPFINQVLWTISRLFTSTNQGATAFLTFVPLVTFSAIYSLWLTFLYQQGFSKTLIIIIFTLFYLNPVNSIQMLALWKDIPYTQALFLLSYIFILFYTIKKYRES